MVIIPREFVSKWKRVTYRQFIEVIIPDGDRVVVGFSPGGFMQKRGCILLRPENPPAYTDVTWARVADDKTIKHYTWRDKTGLMEQVGG